MTVPPCTGRQAAEKQSFSTVCSLLVLAKTEVAVKGLDGYAALAVALAELQFRT